MIPEDLLWMTEEIKLYKLYSQRVLEVRIFSRAFSISRVRIGSACRIKKESRAMNSKVDQKVHMVR